MLGRCTEALAVARVLAERLRDSVSYLGHVAHVFASLGRPEEAGRLYERCVQLDNGPAQHRDLARWHIQQGNYMDAEQCIVSAAKDEPWHSSTFGLRGQLALAHGCFTEALIALKEASDRDCHEIAWRFDLAFAQLGSSEPDALTTFDSALESTELQEQVESALQDLQLLERAQPGLPQLGDIRSQLESRQDSLNRLAEEELQGRSPTWEAGSA